MALMNSDELKNNVNFDAIKNMEQSDITETDDVFGNKCIKPENGYTTKHENIDAEQHNAEISIDYAYKATRSYASSYSPTSDNLRRRPLQTYEKREKEGPVTNAGKSSAKSSGRLSGKDKCRIGFFVLFILLNAAGIYLICCESNDVVKLWTGLKQDVINSIFVGKKASVKEGKDDTNDSVKMVKGFSPPDIEPDDIGYPPAVEQTIPEVQPKETLSPPPAAVQGETKSETPDEEEDEVKTPPETPLEEVKEPVPETPQGEVAEPPSEVVHDAEAGDTAPKEGGETNDAPSDTLKDEAKDTPVTIQDEVDESPPEFIPEQTPDVAPKAEEGEEKSVPVGVQDEVVETSTSVVPEETEDTVPKVEKQHAEIRDAPSESVQEKDEEDEEEDEEEDTSPKAKEKDDEDEEEDEEEDTSSKVKRSVIDSPSDEVQDEEEVRDIISEEVRDTTSEEAKAEIKENTPEVVEDHETRETSSQVEKAETKATLPEIMQQDVQDEIPSEVVEEESEASRMMKEESEDTPPQTKQDEPTEASPNAENDGNQYTEPQVGDVNDKINDNQHNADIPSDKGEQNKIDSPSYTEEYGEIEYDPR